LDRLRREISQKSYLKSIKKETRISRIERITIYQEL